MGGQERLNSEFLPHAMAGKLFHKKRKPNCTGNISLAV